MVAGRRRAGLLALTTAIAAGELLNEARAGPELQIEPVDVPCGHFDGLAIVSAFQIHAPVNMAGRTMKYNLYSMAMTRPHDPP
jgi:hypothetical protein